MKTSRANSVQTVSQITASIKYLLEGEYRFVSVSGEISNLRTPFSGHHYFTLKDQEAQLRAVLFKTQRRYLAEPLKNGQQVICRGRISVYEPRGEYQLIVDTVDQHGLGTLQIQFANLKKKLAEEGLFDQDKKVAMPAYPKKIIVISSPTGAAVHDFLKICSQRQTNIHIQIYPVAVQGLAAAGEIVHAIEAINKQIDCDLIVLCRGGGSIEDLWAFNEECVARAIHQSSIPIITGVGHEIDYTIADFCADVRAPTPTGAAEMAVPDTVTVREHVTRVRTALIRSMLETLERYESDIAQQTRLLGTLGGKFENLALRLDLTIERFNLVCQNAIARRSRQYQSVMRRLESQAPLNRIEIQAQHITHLRDRLRRQMLSSLARREDQLGKLAALLNSTSPLATLSRGYSIVRTEDKRLGTLRVVSRSSEVSPGDTVDILLHEGRLLCDVVEIE